MRLISASILTITLLFAVGSTASAQMRIGGEEVEVGGRIGAGFASAPDALSGLLVAVDGGVIFRAGRVRLPVDLTVGLSSTEAEGFTFDESADRCREDATGRFAESSNCNQIEAAAWGSATLAYDVFVNVESDLRVYVGAGGDVGATTGPHGTLGLYFPVTGSSGMDFEARAWSNQITILVAFAF